MYKTSYSEHILIKCPSKMCTQSLSLNLGIIHIAYTTSKSFNRLRKKFYLKKMIYSCKDYYSRSNACNLTMCLNYLNNI